MKTNIKKIKAKKTISLKKAHSILDKAIAVRWSDECHLSYPVVAKLTGLSDEEFLYVDKQFWR